MGGMVRPNRGRRRVARTPAAGFAFCRPPARPRCQWGGFHQLSPAPNIGSLDGGLWWALVVGALWKQTRMITAPGCLIASMWPPLDTIRTLWERSHVGAQDARGGRGGGCLPHPAQPQHTNHWAPLMRKRHQQEHWPQRPTERSEPTQHAKGRTGDCPGPGKETTTRRNVTRGGGGSVQFRTPTPTAWARGSRGGGWQIFSGLRGIFDLSSPFHSEHVEYTQVRRVHPPFYHSPQMGEIGGNRKMCAPVLRGHKHGPSAAGAQVGCSSLFTVVCVGVGQGRGGMQPDTEDSPVPNWFLSIAHLV